MRQSEAKSCNWLLRSLYTITNHLVFFIIHLCILPFSKSFLRAFPSESESFSLIDLYVSIIDFEFSTLGFLVILFPICIMWRSSGYILLVMTWKMNLLNTKIEVSASLYKLGPERNLHSTLLWINPWNFFPSYNRFGLVTVEQLLFMHNFFPSGKCENKMFGIH